MPEDPEGRETAIRELIEALTSPAESGIRSYPTRELIEAIGRWEGQCQVVFEVLRNHIQHEDPEVVHRAVSGLGWLGRQPGACRGDIRQLLWEVFDQGDIRQDYAFTALSSTRFQPGDLPRLIERLVTPASPWLSRYVPPAIARTLSSFPESAAYLPELMGLLDHGSAKVRFRVACALAGERIGEDPRIIAELSRGLEGTNSTERLMAIETVKALGPRAAEMGPALERFAATTQDTGLADLARTTLAAVDSTRVAANPEVAAAVAADQERKLWQERFGRDEIPVSELLRDVGHPDRSQLVVKKLAAMDSLPPEAADLLYRALAGQQEWVRNEMTAIITRLDPNRTIERVDRKTVSQGILAALQEASRVGAGRPNPEVETLLTQPRFSSWWTPEEVRAYAGSLGKMEPKVRDAFVAGVLQEAPSLRPFFAGSP